MSITYSATTQSDDAARTRANGVLPHPDASPESARLSPRLMAARADVLERGGSFAPGRNPFLADVAIWRATQPGRSRVQVRGAFLYEMAALAPVEIRPHWSLAGEHLVSFHWHYFALGGNGPMPPLERLSELGVDPSQASAIRDAVNAHIGTRLNWRWASVGESDPELMRGGSCRPGFPPDSTGPVFQSWGWIENHSARGYARALREGFAGLGREIDGRLAQSDPADPDFPACENFWRAARMVCDAGCLLASRYSQQAAEQAARASDPADRARLQRTSRACAQLAIGGARDLFEAVQALWLAHILTCCEDGINANSIGRLDQMLEPFYRADIEAGRSTPSEARAEALELMEELACKLYLDYDGQAIVLGGLDREGRSAVGELSRIILEATGNVGFVRDQSVRLNRESPPDFVEQAARLIVRGGGIPFVFNDDCFIPALVERGIALEDARDYAPIGCIEMTVPGRAHPRPVSGWFCSTKCLELALFDGRDPRTGEQLGPKTGALEDFATFDDLYAAYARQVDFFARRMVYHCNRGEMAQREGGPLPLYSTLTDDCIARGRDITDGGAVYDYHSISFLGTANTADALMAVRRLVFAEKRIAPADLLQALRDDFQGCEALRQTLLLAAPKYGNDRPEVDALAARVSNDFIDLMDTMRSPGGGRYFVHLFSHTAHIFFGQGVGATPDGRHAGQPLAYSLSAHAGRDLEGVTAMLQSLARLPHARAAGGTAAIVELDPAVVAGPAGVQRMAQLLRAAIDMGVGQLQWNIVTAERLRQAQDDPERHGNIAVRVAGFSQLFRLVDRPLQDHIIARTKHLG